MPRRCTVCDHPQREEIDARLVAGRDTITNIANAYGVHRLAVFNHRKAHLAQAIVHVEQQQERSIASVRNLLREIDACFEDVWLARRIVHDKLGQGEFDERALRLLLDTIGQARATCQTAVNMAGMALEQEKFRQERDQAEEDAGAIVADICRRRLTAKLGEANVEQIVALLLAEEE